MNEASRGRDREKPAQRQINGAPCRRRRPTSVLEHEPRSELRHRRIGRKSSSGHDVEVECTQRFEELLVRAEAREHTSCSLATSAEPAASREEWTDCCRRMIDASTPTRPTRSA